MNAPDFHAERLTGLGSSDAAPALGLSPYKTPLALFAEKTGEAPPIEDNAAMEWGRRLELPIIQAYAEKTGAVNSLIVAPQIVRAVQHPFMLAHLDAQLPDRVVEAKTARTDQGWGEPGTDQIPQAYLLQVTHQMVVTGLQLADIAVLIGGSDFRVYPIQLDPELAELVIEGERIFWERVQRRDPPPPTTLAEAQLRWPKSKAVAVDLPPNVAECYQRLCAARRQMTELETQADKDEFAVKTWMGEAEIALVDGIEAATWRTAKASRVFDRDRFKTDLPDLYAQYQIERAGSRRFLLKGVNDA